MVAPRRCWRRPFPPWHRLVRLLDRLKVLFVLSGITLLGRFDGNSVGAEENSYNVDRADPTIYPEAHVLKKLSTLSHTYASPSSSDTSIESWINGLPRGSRNRITIYQPDVMNGNPDSVPFTTNDFLLLVTPILGDTHDALLVVITDHQNPTIAYGPTTYGLAFAQGLAESKWLAKSAYFLFLRDGNKNNTGVKRFVDWYLYGRGFPLRIAAPLIASLDQAPLRRQGVLRQALGITDFKPAVSSTGKVEFHVNKIGLKNPNIDFVSKSLRVIASHVNTNLTAHITREINSEVELMEMPHTYLNECVVDAMSLQLHTPMTGPSPDKLYFLHAIEALVRGINEMVLDFHHLSSQYWLTQNASKGLAILAADNHLLGYILLSIGLLAMAFSDVAQGVSDGDKYVWRSRRESFRLSRLANTVVSNGAGGVAAHVEERDDRGASSCPVYEETVSSLDEKVLPALFMGDESSGYIGGSMLAGCLGSIVYHVVSRTRPLITCDTPREVAEWKLRGHLVNSFGWSILTAVVVCSAYGCIVNKVARIGEQKTPLLQQVRLLTDFLVRGLHCVFLVWLISLYVSTLVDKRSLQVIKPSLGLVLAVILPAICVLPSPFDLATLTYLYFAGAKIPWAGGPHWDFLSVLKNVEWNYLLANTIRAESCHLTRLDAYSLLVSCLTILGLIVVCKLITGF